jgi:anaerobic magnesium-protoporphyrin IX monomethyl ester cyclase
VINSEVRLDNSAISRRDPTRELVVVLVALYRYQNFPIRIIHPLLEEIDGVTPHSIFFKHVDANTFDPFSDTEGELFAKTISDLNPDLVGFSVMSPHVPIVKDLNAIVRKNSNAKIIWGGVHPTIDPEQCIEEADIVCVGEGEGAISDLVERMRDGEDYSDIQNLWVRNSNGTVKNPGRLLIQDLDALPFPSYANDSYIFINEDKLDRQDRALEDRLLWIQGSRGCPFVCAFCVNSVTQPLFKDKGKYRRVRSPENIAEEIKGQLQLVKQANLPEDWKHTVLFVDEVFGNDKEWLKDFETVYPREVGLPYYMETLPHSNLINESTLNSFVNSGVDTINFGIQTGSDYIRNTILRRPTKNKQIVEIANTIADRGVKVRYDLISDNPYDTVETLIEAVNLIVQLPKPLEFNMFRLQWFPGYPLTKRALEDGLITIEDTTVDSLVQRTTNDWAYVPRWEPFNRKTAITNIIWLIVWGHTSDNIALFAVSTQSIPAMISLQVLNVKAWFLGKLFGIGGLVGKHIWLARINSAFGLIGKREFKKLLSETIRILKIKLMGQSGELHNANVHSGHHKMSD